MNSSNKKDNRVNKKVRLDKQSGANIILAFMVCCFLYTVFLATNSMNISYAAPNDSPPSNLTYTGRMLSNSTGVKEVWTFMGDDLAWNIDFKASPDGGITNYHMYCIEKQIGVTGTSSYHNPQPLPSNYAPGLAFILNNGFPNDSTSSYLRVCNDTSFTNEPDNCKKYITQFAIWYYLDKMGVKDSKNQSQLTTAELSRINSLSNTHGVANAVVKLANAAINYNSQNQAAAQVSVVANNVTYSIIEGGKYLESSEIAINTNLNSNLQSFTVSIIGANPTGAFIVDTAGNNITTFGTGARFKVRIPMDQIPTAENIDLHINVVASFKVDTVYVYTPSTGTGQDQRPIIAGFNESSTNASISLRIPIVEIAKTDITNGKPVVGAVLTILDEAGNEIARWTTDENKHYIALAAGNYVLKETSSPDGYELNEESVNFTVKDDGSITRVEMKNTPTTNVPSTAASIPVYLYIIGAMILVIGAGVIYVTTRTKRRK